MTAVSCPRSFELAGGDFNACMLIGELRDLAGGNEHAEALLWAAQEQLADADLDSHLRTHAQPAMFARGGYNGAFINAAMVEHYVGMLRVWDNDQAEFAHTYGGGWERDHLVAEIFRHLVPLLTGRPACQTCLRYGSLSHVGAVGVEGDCELHDAKRCAA
jgi:hypothetical protein